MARTAEEIKASMIANMFDESFGEVQEVVAIVRSKRKDGVVLIRTVFTAETNVGRGLDLIKSGWRTLRANHFSFTPAIPGTLGLVRIINGSGETATVEPIVWQMKD